MLSYHLSEERKKSSLFLIVEIENKELGFKRFLYIDTLKKLAPAKDWHTIQFFIDQELRYLGISPLSSSVKTTPFNLLHISPKNALEALKHLASLENVFWKGKKLTIDLLPSAELFYEASFCRIEGKLRILRKEVPLSSCQWIFPSSPPFCVCEGLLYIFLKDLDWKWVEWVYPDPKALSEKQWENFKDQFDDGEILKAPKVIWNETKKEEKLVNEPLPFLLLKDRSGAFADLWMQYPQGEVALHDPIKMSWRDLKLENYWKKDLLETDYKEKIVSDSHYFCPLDKVAKSLSFLLELGWKIFDWKGKQVFKQKQSHLNISLEKQFIVVEGTLKYADHETNLKEVIGIFNRREKFVQLSDNAVGLLDDDFFKDLGPLSEEEFLGKKIAIKKQRFGLYDTLFGNKSISQDAQIETLKQKLDPELLVSDSSPTSLFKGKLHPYQQAGLNWLLFLYGHNFGGLLADEMGLGKTVQVLALFSHFTSEKSVLIVTPTSLIFNWRKEFEKFLPTYSVYEHKGLSRLLDLEKIQEKKIILTSYVLLRQDQALFKSLKYDAVILDEAQNIKNPDSQIAKVTCDLCAEFRLAITGTPIENRLNDLWSIFHFLMPELLEEKREFENKLLLAQSNQLHLQQIKKKIRPFILRRKKEVIADQLPEKIEQLIWVEMSEAQQKLYEEFLKTSRQGLKKKITENGSAAHRMEILETILRLRQICCHPRLVYADAVDVESSKMQRLMEDLEGIVEENGKVLVYSQFTSMLKIIQKEIEQKAWIYGYLDGDTKNREEIIQRFQNDPNLNIFLISLKAGGVGLNLTAANYVILFDPWWNEAVEEQAIDRAHRLGCKQTLIARRFITGNSIEEKILKLKAHKTSLKSGFLDFDDEIHGIGIDELWKLLEEVDL